LDEAINSDEAWVVEPRAVVRRAIDSAHSWSPRRLAGRTDAMHRLDRIQ
jgi:hypothetical protein